MSEYVPGIDPKVSVLGGESLKDYTRYKRSVEASVLGCDSEEHKEALGPKLYKNLLALNNHARHVSTWLPPSMGNPASLEWSRRMCATLSSPLAGRSFMTVWTAPASTCCRLSESAYARVASRTSFQRASAIRP